MTIPNINRPITNQVDLFIQQAASRGVSAGENEQEGGAAGVSPVEQYKSDVSADESQWWFELAKREYFYKEDRKKEYNPEIPETEEEPQS